MQKIKHTIIGLLISASVISVVPATVSATPLNHLTTFAVCTNGSVLTFPAWHKGLTQDPNSCAPKITQLNDIWKIVLNIVEMMMQIAGYAAAGFMMWGGFKYIKSQGNPQNIASAKSTLMNAGIGLGIALSSVAIINFVGTTIK